jgi:hypothetical protein
LEALIRSASPVCCRLPKSPQECHISGHTFLRFAVLIACAASISFAQDSVSFKPYTSTAGDTPANVYAVDLNGDGYSDLLQDSGISSPASFTVSLSNGDGMFKAPVQYCSAADQRQ